MKKNVSPADAAPENVLSTSSTYTTVPIPLLLNVPTKIKAKMPELSVLSAASAAASVKKPVLPVRSM